MTPLGRRPQAVAKRAAAILDDDQSSARVRDHPGDLVSDAGSYGREPGDHRRTVMTTTPGLALRLVADRVGNSGGSNHRLGE